MMAVLRQKDETKNKKKITETEIEAKTSELFSNLQTVLLSEEEDAIVLLSPDFTKNKIDMVNQLGVIGECLTIGLDFPVIEGGGEE